MKKTIIGLLVLTCIGRIPFATKYIVVHDSVGFALALKHFDLSKHQPHPPGYIIYIGLAKLLNSFIKDANTSFISLSILFSMLAVVFIYLLGKEILNSRSGLISALFLWSSPVFWAYGELALSYIADAVGSTLIAYLSYKVIKGEKQFTPILTIALGVVSGIRVYLLPFLLPIWIMTIRSSRKQIIKQGFILVIVCLCWVIPLMILSDGVSNYFAIHFSHFKSAMLPQYKLLKTFAYAFAGSLWGLGATVLPLLISMRSKVFYQDKKKVHFLTIWCGPIVIFSFILFMGNPGCILFYLPCFILLSSTFAYKQFNIKKCILVWTIILTNIILFFTVKPLTINDRILGINTNKFRNFANFWMLDYSNKGLRKKESEKEIIDIISSSFSPETTLIAARDSRSLQPYIPWRIAYYYLPDFQLVRIQSESQVIGVSPNINTIIWLMDKNDLNMKIVENHKEIYFSPIKDTLIMQKLIFVKEKSCNVSHSISQE